MEPIMKSERVVTSEIRSRPCGKQTARALGVKKGSLVFWGVVEVARVWQMDDGEQSGNYDKTSPEFATREEAADAIVAMTGTTYAITATNHGLNDIPCDIPATLFGRYKGPADGDRETSREFATRAEADAALTALENSGDWPDGAPEYEIVEVA